MTDRIKALTVVLEKNTRTDDAEGLIAAIGEFRGVLTVRPEIADPSDFIAEQRARRALVDQLWKVLEEPEPR